MEDKRRLDIEFNTTLIRFFKNFLEKADKINETYEDMKRDQLEIKRDQLEIKKTLSVIKKYYTESYKQTGRPQESRQRFRTQRARGHSSTEARR